MKKKKVKYPKPVKNCGSRKKGGCDWAGATTMIKHIRLAA